MGRVDPRLPSSPLAGLSIRIMHSAGRESGGGPFSKREEKWRRDPLLLLIYRWVEQGCSSSLLDTSVFMNNCVPCMQGKGQLINSFTVHTHQVPMYCTPPSSSFLPLRWTSPLGPVTNHTRQHKSSSSPSSSFFPW